MGALFRYREEVSVSETEVSLPTVTTSAGRVDNSEQISQTAAGGAPGPAHSQGPTAGSAR